MNMIHLMTIIFFIHGHKLCCIMYFLGDKKAGGDCPYFKIW